MPITEDRITKLREFGLSEYAARTYLALLDLGVSEARVVSKLTKVPTSKIYNVLDQLHEKGLVEILPEFPKKYAPIPFVDYLETLQRGHKEAAQAIERDRDALTKLFRFQGDVAIADRGNFTVIRGRRNVVAKLTELLDVATEDVIVLATAGTASHLNNLRDHLKDARARGVKLRVKAPLSEATLPKFGRLDKLVEIRARSLDSVSPADHVGIVLVDAAQALLINFVPDDDSPFTGQDVAIFTDQEALVGALRAIVEPHWAHAADFATRRAEILEGRAPGFTRVYSSAAEATTAIRGAIEHAKADIRLATNDPTMKRTPLPLDLFERHAEAGLNLQLIANVERSETVESLSAWNVRHCPPDALPRILAIDDREAFMFLAAAAGDDGAGELVVHTTNAGSVASVLAQFETLWKRAQPIEARVRELEMFPNVRPIDVGLGGLFDTIQDGVVVANRRGEIVLWNSGAEKIFGFPRGEAVGANLEIIIPEEFRERHRAGFTRYQREGEANLVDTGDVLTLDAVRKGGGRVVVELTLSSLKDSRDGGYVLAIARDVTERVRSLKLLEESERRLAGAQRVAKIGSWSWEVETGRVEWSPELVERYGGPADGRMTIDDYLTRVHPDDVPRLKPMIEKALASESEIESRHRMVRLDGTVLWCYARAEIERDANGRPVRVSGVSQDITDLRAMEDELANAEKQLEGLVDSVEAILWRADAKTFQFTFVSAEAEKILGYPREKWLEPGFWAKRLHPEDAEWAVNLCVRETAAGRSHEFEYRMLDAKGETVWLRDIVRVVVKDGEPTELLGIMVDIRARKRIEAEVHKARELTEAVLRSTAAGILAFDAEGRYTLWNHEMEKLTGRKASEILGRRADEVFPFLKSESPAPRIERVLAGESFSVPDQEYEFGNGRKAWLEARYAPLKDSSGAVVGGVGVVRDTSDRRDAMMKLQASESRYRLLAENASDVIATTAPDGTVTYVSPSIYNVFGLEPSEFIGRRGMDFVHPDDKDYLMAMRERALAGEPMRSTFRMRGADGTWIWVETSTRPILDERGTVLQTVSVTRDVSAQKAAEEQLLRQRDLHESLLRGMDSLGDGYFVQDGDRVLDASEAYCRIVGYTVEELRNLPSVLELVPPDLRDAARERIRRRIDGEDPATNVETELLTKDGRRVPVKASVRRVGSPGVVRFVCLVRPLTQEAPAENVTLQPASRAPPERRARRS